MAMFGTGTTGIEDLQWLGVTLNLPAIVLRGSAKFVHSKRGATPGA